VTRSLHEVFVDCGVAIPMRDGTILRANVYRPQEPGRYPVIVERTPYDAGLRVDDGRLLASHGFVYVAQHVRGRFVSDGVFDPWHDDGWGGNHDGQETVEWAAHQSWSNGSVGMGGGSYAGYTQLLAAVTRPSHLRTLVIRQGLTNAGRDLVYRGGVHQLLQCREWMVRAALLQELEHESAPPESRPLRDALRIVHADLETWLRHLPVRSFPPIEGVADWYLNWLEHPQGDAYWSSIEVDPQFGAIDVPVLHLGGWFDPFLDATLRTFVGLRRDGASEGCRTGQRLLIGPWCHWSAGVDKRRVGELDFGPEADLDYDALRVNWYDAALRSASKPELPTVRLFVMGDNHWYDFEDWPPSGTTYQPLFLRAGSRPSAESLNNGRLTFETPTYSEPSDGFMYDPLDPVPSLVGYPSTGPYDHRSIEGRVLTFTSEVLTAPLVVVGPVRGVLYAQSSAPDTDWVVRLCDVWPDGRSMSVCDGILRARYRTSFQQPELMAPGQVYRFDIDLWATAQVFQPGHRLRVQVTSSDFPRYARNLNTSGDPIDEVQPRVALNTIFHDARYASHIVLPVMDRAQLSGTTSTEHGVRYAGDGSRR
jgi:putative CocE/NonD family hydrolase